jgi:hypothetical protein
MRLHSAGHRIRIWLDDAIGVMEYTGSDDEERLHAISIHPHHL